MQLAIMLLKHVLRLLIVIAVTDGSDVLKLTDENFDTLLAEKQIVLVNFRTAKCPECEKLKPEFVKAAAVLKDHDPPVVFAQINCYREGKEACTKHGISQYPDIKIFRNGVKAFDYNGPLDSDGMVQYVRKKVPLISKELMSTDDVQAFIDNIQCSVIGFFERKDSVIFERYEMFASTLNEYFRFGHTFSEDAREYYGYTNTFLIFRSPLMQSKFEPDRVEYQGVYNPYKMRDWLLANAFGLVGYRTKNTANFFSNPLVVTYYNIDYVKNAKAANYWRNRILKVAQSFHDSNVTFAMSDVREFDQELADHSVTVKDPTQPTVIGRDNANKPHVMSEDFSVEALESFVRRMLTGTLKPDKKPEPQDKKSLVQVVVGETFDNIVNDPTKDILIGLCDSQSDQCKHLEQIYVELAYKLKDKESIVIAKMDGTAESVPQPYRVLGFPTVYFAPMGSKQEPKLYEGALDITSLMEFLLRESTLRLQGSDDDNLTKTEL